MRHEILAQITAPYFVAGLVLVDDEVTKTAPILHFMRGWSRVLVRSHCREKKWAIRVVRQWEPE